VCAERDDAKQALQQLVERNKTALLEPAEPVVVFQKGDRVIEVGVSNPRTGVVTAQNKDKYGVVGVRFSIHRIDWLSPVNLQKVPDGLYSVHDVETALARTCITSEVLAQLKQGA